MENILALAFIAYFVPSLVAWKRGHPQQTAIIVLNIFGGWTLIGWVGALVWASTAIYKPPLVAVAVPPPALPLNRW